MRSISMFERNEFGGKRLGGPENDPMNMTINCDNLNILTLYNGNLVHLNNNQQYDTTNH